MSKNENVKVAEVIVEVPARNTNQPFDYLIPTNLLPYIAPGSRVIVPFGPRRIQGYVLQTKIKEENNARLKAIDRVLDELPPLTEELIQLGEWMSREYICLHITALQAMLPAVLKSKTEKFVRQTSDGQAVIDYRVKDNVTKRFISVVKPERTLEELKHAQNGLNANAKKQQEVIQYFIEKHEKITLSDLLQACQTTRSTIQSLEKKGLVSIGKEEWRRDPYHNHTFLKTKALALTAEQQSSYNAIKKSMEREEYKTFLLHGVTGSGKTEIYLQTIAYAISKSKESIVLVPEISLTPQMVERFKGRFGDQVAVVHSRLSSGERYDEWRKIHEGRVKVVIGARSALFAPFRNLGLIIIDEEHESTYKQEENPRYHARDIAIFRGQYHQAPVVLGSATPSLESYARAQKGVFQLLSLQERVHGRPLPPVTIVDMREELHTGNRSMFSQALYEKITERLERKEQIVLFLNRRGFSTFVMCRDCGFVVNCPHCDISLTYHKTTNSHRCHYCGYTQKKIHTCPECNSEHIRFFGTGTQKVEEELYKHFPGMKVIRMDVDTTQRKGSHERYIQAFKNQQADCLLGTQMIAKGLDFENVTLVGVIAADSLLHLPDFRAAEKTFQLLTQVSGRAGRHQLPGEVIVQTYTPEHYSIQCASGHDYLAFYQQEMRLRHERGYAPYYYLTLITFVHEDLPYLVKMAEQGADWLKQHLSASTVILGPVASPIPKVKDRYRYQCMVKYKSEPMLSGILNQLLEKMKIEINKKKLHIHIDVRP